MQRVVHFYIDSQGNLTSPQQVEFMSGSYGSQTAVVHLPNESYASMSIRMYVKDSAGDVAIEETRAVYPIAEIPLTKAMADRIGPIAISFAVYNNSGSAILTTNTIYGIMVASIDAIPLNTVPGGVDAGCEKTETVGDLIDALNDAIDNGDLDNYVRKGTDTHLRDVVMRKTFYPADGGIYFENCTIYDPILEYKNGVRFGYNDEMIFMNSSRTQFNVLDEDSLQVYERTTGGTYTVLHTGNIAPFLYSSFRQYYGLDSLDIPMDDSEIPAMDMDGMVQALLTRMTTRPALFLMATHPDTPNFNSNMPVPNCYFKMYVDTIGNCTFEVQSFRGDNRVFFGSFGDK